MNDLREQLRAAAESTPPAPEVWTDLDARIRDARRRRWAVPTVAATAAAVTAAVVILTNGGMPGMTPDRPAVAASRPSASALELRLAGFPNGWTTQSVDEARALGVKIPTTGQGSWTATPSGNQGVLLWRNADGMGLPGLVSDGPLNLEGGPKVLQSDDAGSGVAYLEVWLPEGGDVLFAVRASDAEERDRLIRDIASTTLKDVLAATPVAGAVDLGGVVVAVPEGCSPGDPEFAGTVWYGNEGLMDLGSTPEGATVGLTPAQMTGRTMLCSPTKISIHVLTPLTDDGSLSKRMYATSVTQPGAEALSVPGLGDGFFVRTNATNASATIPFADLSGGLVASIGAGDPALLLQVLASARRVP